MKKLILMIVCVGLLSSFALAQAKDSRAIRVQESPATQFLMSINKMLRDVSPSYTSSYKKFESDMKSVMVKLKGLQDKLKKLDRKGAMKGKAYTTEEELIKEGEALLDKAFDLSDAYLKTLQEELKNERESLKKALLPKPKKKN